MVARRSHTEFAAEFPCHELDPHKVSLAFIPPGSPGVCVHGREQLMPRLYPTHTLISATLPPRSVTWAHSRPPCSTASNRPLLSALSLIPPFPLPTVTPIPASFSTCHVMCYVRELRFPGLYHPRLSTWSDGGVRSTILTALVWLVLPCTLLHCAARPIPRMQSRPDKSWLCRLKTHAWPDRKG